MDIEKDLLYQMKRIRAVEEAIAEKYSEWKMRCPTHLCTGQESVAVGTCVHLNKDDFAVSTHRAHGHYLAKGGDMKRMIAEIYGKATGCSSGKGGSMHIIDESVGFKGSTSIVGGTIPVGTGLGLSIRLNGTKQVSCVFFGDGATEEGVFYESINFAALRKLPVLYICENNLYSVYSPLSVRQPSGRNIVDIVKCMGVASDQGDGNDVLNVYEKVRQAIDYIKEGKGPFFLEFTTYRWREHCGPNFDNDLGYRTYEEYEEWLERDPIALLEIRLRREKKISDIEVKKMNLMIGEEVNSAFDYAEKSPFPAPEEAYTQLYRN